MGSHHRVRELCQRDSFIVIGVDHREDILRQNGLCLSAFPMFVPSLSWQNHNIHM